MLSDLAGDLRRSVRGSLSLPQRASRHHLLLLLPASLGRNRGPFIAFHHLRIGGLGLRHGSPPILMAFGRQGPHQRLHPRPPGVLHRRLRRRGHFRGGFPEERQNRSVEKRGLNSARFVALHRRLAAFPAVLDGRIGAFPRLHLTRAADLLVGRGLGGRLLRRPRINRGRDREEGLQKLPGFVDQIGLREG